MREDYKSETLTDHEKYLAGEPLNDELRDLRDGKTPEPLAPVLPWPIPEPMEDAERDLTRTERLALKELRASDGWPAMMRLLEMTVLLHRKSVITFSERDPLNHKDEIANQWAYLNSLRSAKQAIQALVDAEVKKADEER